MKALFVFAPAASGKVDEGILAWCNVLQAAGHAVVHFNYLRSGGKAEAHAPYHADVVCKAAAAHPGLPIFLIGRSMGSRVGMHALAELPADVRVRVRGLVCWSYPLIAKTVRDAVLREVDVPTLFLAGSKDTMAGSAVGGAQATLGAEVHAAGMHPLTRVVVVDGGSHALAVGKRDLQRQETTQAQVTSGLLDEIKAFAAAAVAAPAVAPRASAAAAAVAAAARAAARSVKPVKAPKKAAKAAGAKQPAPAAAADAGGPPPAKRARS